MDAIIKPSCVIIFALIFASCGNDNTTSSESQNIIDFTISNSEIFLYDLEFSGDEEGASIIKQAQNMEISELFRDENRGMTIVYRCKPNSGYTGVDYVEIETCRGGVGIICTQIDTIRIRFTIIN